QHVRNLKVLVAPRTNIFQELDFGRKGGGQEEKFRAPVLEMRWTKADLEALLDERLKISAKGSGFETSSIASILPAANNTMGIPIDYLLDRTLLRPRDAIAFANECLAVGVGKDRLSWADIKTAERSYSVKRLLALRDEWKATYPGINGVLEKFRRCPVRMTIGEFQQRLDDIMLLLSEPDFEGVKWLTEVTSAMWTAGPNTTWFEMYQPLTQILFNVGLIGMSSRSSANPLYLSDDAHWVEQESNIERAEYFYIHRAYHEGLDMQSTGRR